MQFHGQVRRQEGGEIGRTGGMVEAEVDVAAGTVFFPAPDDGFGINGDDRAPQLPHRPGPGAPATFTGVGVDYADGSGKHPVLYRGGVFIGEPEGGVDEGHGYFPGHAPGSHRFAGGS